VVVVNGVYLKSWDKGGHFGGSFVDFGGALAELRVFVVDGQKNLHKKN
jgi:hypothetical protein